MSIRGLGGVLFWGCVLGTGVLLGEPVPGSGPKPGSGRQAVVSRYAQQRREGIRRAMEQFRQKHPEDFTRLEELKSQDKAAYLVELKAFLPLQDWYQVKIFQLEQESTQLARQYRQARTEEERSTLKSELQRKVEECTDAMLENLRFRMERMQKQLAQKEAHRDELVARRVENLLRGGRGGRGGRGKGIPAGK